MRIGKSRVGKIVAEDEGGVNIAGGSGRRISVVHIDFSGTGSRNRRNFNPKSGGGGSNLISHPVRKHAAIILPDKTDIAEIARHLTAYVTAKLIW